MESVGVSSCFLPKPTGNHDMRTRNSLNSIMVPKPNLMSQEMTTLTSSLPSTLPSVKRLMLIHQSTTEFWKDMGGMEKNHITIQLKLEGVPPNVYVPLSIKSTLYFESGKCVEEREQHILNVMAKNKYILPTIDQNTMTATINFRLEKVSRRKDGQRFKVLFELDSSNPSIAALNIQPVFSHPIYVYSKVKSEPNRSGKRRMSASSESPKRIHKEDLTNESPFGHLQRMEERLSDMMRQMQDSLEARLDTIESRIENIEDVLQDRKRDSERDTSGCFPLQNMLSFRSGDLLNDKDVEDLRPGEILTRPALLHFRSSEKMNELLLDTCVESTDKNQSDGSVLRFSTADFDFVVQPY